MKKVYIWGVGDFVQEVLELIDLKKCDFRGFLDIDINKIGTLYKGIYPIHSIKEISSGEYDYIVCSIKNSVAVDNAITEYGLEKGKIISYWRDELFGDFFDANMVKIRRLENENRKLRSRLENAPYEWGYYKTPQILSGDKLLEKIIMQGNSLVRFGDGEFEMMRLKKRPWFQNPNEGLSSKLIQIINSCHENIEIAIADNFGNLDKYTEDAAEGIREYMTLETRNAIMAYLHMNRIYGDAYVTRPYLMYKDKNFASRIFSLYKRLWKNRNILMVEGRYTRMGINNGLFDGASSVTRIICPPQNAFDKYDVIYQKVCSNAKSDDLILISLGPTATVLSYDLAIAGYQAIDIVQLDHEYEWYLKKAVVRVEIENKMVSELSWCRKPDEMDNMEYISQIIDVIE